jgi:TIR domain
MAEVLCCYARKDELLLNQLKSHLRPLQWRGLIHIVYDRDISAGTEWEREISMQLNTAHIILFLISPAFMDSDYGYGVEMKRALERHERGEAIVIPVLLRPVYWQGTPFDRLQVLPSDERPVTKWNNRDETFVHIAKGIRRVIAQEPPEILAPASAQYSSSQFTHHNMPIEKPSAWQSDMPPRQRHFRTGELVKHQEFGHGTINRTGFVDNCEFTDVQFDQYGIRRLWQLQKLPH